MYEYAILKEVEHTLQQVNQSQIERVVQTVADHRGQIFLAGCGRTGYMLRCFAMRLHHMGFSAYYIGDTTCPVAQEGDLVILGSGSGETERLVAYGKKAKALSLSTILFTTRPDSTLAATSDAVVTIPAGNKLSGQGLQPMGALFEQALLLTLDGIVLSIMEENEIPSQDMVSRHANLE